MKYLKTSFVLIPVILLMLLQTVSYAQLTRERVVVDTKVENVFWATSNVGISTVRNLSAKSLNTSIAHTFGYINGGIDRFYGLDDGANTRLGIDYGFTDRFSLGIGRMTFNKLVDIRGKYNVLRQTTSGTTPLDLAVKFSVGINTTSGIGLDFSDRLSYFTSLMAARKFNRISLQLTPMMAHFNNVAGNNPKQLYGVGILINYELNDRFALSTEYLPVIGERHIATQNALAFALNIDTGGHIFQVYLTTSQWHNEQFIMANNRDRFFDGDFRFGFNIHRVFGLYKR